MNQRSAQLFLGVDTHYTVVYTCFVKLPTWNCKHCGHKWHPRKNEKPLRCGKCKSPYWDTPKKVKRA